MGVKNIFACEIGDIEEGSYKSGKPEVVVEKSAPNGEGEIITLWKNHINKYQVDITYPNDVIKIFKNIPGSPLDCYYKRLSPAAAWDEYKEACRFKGCDPFPDH